MARKRNRKKRSTKPLQIAAKKLEHYLQSNPDTWDREGILTILKEQLSSPGGQPTPAPIAVEQTPAPTAGPTSINQGNRVVLIELAATTLDVPILTPGWVIGMRRHNQEQFPIVRFDKINGDRSVYYKYLRRVPKEYPEI